MPDIHYPWKRFWSPRQEAIRLSDAGYLPDPTMRWERHTNPSLQSFEALEKIPCLVLLGEPRIGKTEALKPYREPITHLNGTPYKPLWIDLSHIHSDLDLRHKLLNQPDFRSWKKGARWLCLFLDGLDESPVGISHIRDTLLPHFEQGPREQLLLRIICRTADWQEPFEHALKQLWDNQSVQVYELAPLRRVDVATAAHANTIDAGIFIQALERAEAVPLAIKPPTLQLLINLYWKSGGLPATPTDLYQRACHLLCEETNPNRQASKQIGTFPPEDRLMAAESIAVVTRFAHYDLIWIGPDQGNIPQGALTFEDLHQVDAENWKDVVATMREVLATGLFATRHPHEFGWSHPSYVDFLAARYLKRQGVSLEQVKTLLTHPDDMSGKLVPHYYGVAAWLASMRPDVLRMLIPVEPEILLHSDLTTTGAEDRAALAAALLRFYDEEQALDEDSSLSKCYHKLTHLQLAEQLRPYIMDPTKGIVVRRVAILITAACQERVLQQELLQVALNPAEHDHVREMAVYAIGAMGDAETKQALRPLLQEKGGADPYDRIKGQCLKALWPDFVSSRELLNVLTPPQKAHHFGAYEAFLLSDFVSQISPGDLPVALAWAEKHAHLPGQNALHQVVDAILAGAWRHLDAPSAREGLAQVMLARLQHHDVILDKDYQVEKIDEHHQPLSFGESLQTHHEKRHQLLETLISLLSSTSIHPMQLVISNPPLVTTQDVSWLLEQLRQAPSEEQGRFLAQLIATVVDPFNPEQVDTVQAASDLNPLLAEYVQRVFQQVLFGSPTTEAMKARSVEQQDQETPQLKQAVTHVDSMTHVTSLLDECESSNSAAWWRLNEEIIPQPVALLGKDAGADLMQVPAWKEADAATRKRIIEAAKRYILEQDPDKHGWFGDTTQTWAGKATAPHPQAFAGYRALLLLQKTVPVFIATLPERTWKRWAPILVTYPLYRGNSIQEAHDAVIQMAYRVAAPEMIETFVRQMDQHNQEMGHLTTLHMIEACWDAQLETALLQKVKDERLQAGFWRELLAGLMSHVSSRVVSYAESLLEARHANEAAYRQAVAAACLLLTHAKDADWAVIWPIFQQEQAFGLKVLLTLLEVPLGSSPLPQRLTEEQVADLFIWLAHQFPADQEPEFSDSGWVTDTMRMYDWQRGLVVHLQRQATQQACAALRKIIQAFPKLQWIRWQLHAAERLMRERNRYPFAPATIWKLTGNQKARLVQNGQQLLTVVMESLTRLQQEFAAQTPPYFAVWNDWTVKVGRKKLKLFRPKDEQGLSDFIKYYLDKALSERNIILNREVQIRQGLAGIPGERTDIHIETKPINQRGVVTGHERVIVEVKGCWHPGLFTAMESQLVDRYLKDTSCPYGLYVVGWFNCPQWDVAGDTREPPKQSLEEIQAQLADQAARLSSEAGGNVKVEVFILDMTFG